jgi:hypothetical protein
MKQTKQQLIDTLKDMIGLIEVDDSFGGFIEYEAGERHEFEVRASYRTGNSEGQGGMRIIRGAGEE